MRGVYKYIPHGDGKFSIWKRVDFGAGRAWIDTKMRANSHIEAEQIISKLRQEDENAKSQK